jgi:trk system potassium uptake protein TrkH
MSDQTPDGTTEGPLPDRILAGAEADDWLNSGQASPARTPGSAAGNDTGQPFARKPVGERKRQTAYRRAPFKTWLYMVGLLTILFSATMLPPIAVAWWYDGYDVIGLV